MFGYLGDMFGSDIFIKKDGTSPLCVVETGEEYESLFDYTHKQVAYSCPEDLICDYQESLSKEEWESIIEDAQGEEEEWDWFYESFQVILCETPWCDYWGLEFLLNLYQVPYEDISGPHNGQVETYRVPLNKKKGDDERSFCVEYNKSERCVMKMWWSDEEAGGSKTFENIEELLYYVISVYHRLRATDKWHSYYNHPFWNKRVKDFEKLRKNRSRERTKEMLAKIKEKKEKQLREEKQLQVA